MKCDSCGKKRTLREGLCHECEQAERDRESLTFAEVDPKTGEEYFAPGVVGAKL